MGLHCLVCKNNSSNQDISFHRFPKENRVRHQWCNLCHLKTEEVNVTMRICSDHFVETDFIDNRAGGGFRRLKQGSIPVIRKRARTLMFSKLSRVPAEVQSSEGNESNGNSTTSVVLNVKDAVDEQQIGHETYYFPLNDHEVDEEQTTTLPVVDDNEIVEDHIYNYCPTPQWIRLNAPQHVGDPDSLDASTANCNTSLECATNLIRKLRIKIKSLHNKNRWLLRKNKSMKHQLQHLKKKNKLLTQKAMDDLMTSIPKVLRDILKRNLTKGTKKYGPELRTFALTLHFYSDKAYQYVRRKLNNCLPASSTIREWYCVVKGRPGFTKEAFEAIANRTKISPCIVNIVLDDMSIRQQILFDKHSGNYYGYVDLGIEGTDKECDNLQQAKYAFVILAVALNGGWKLPLGYFLICGLSGSERANILRTCMELLHTAGAIVCSVTFDGSYINSRMCHHLGANLEYGPEFRPHFINPMTNDLMFLMFDPCHMMKLIRNTLGDKTILRTRDGRVVNWEVIVNLNSLQHKEELHAANKLSKKHINYQENKMNVRLAVQTLSASVASALKFVNELGISGFEDVEGTVEFCQMFNDVFDLLNCRNRFSKKNEFNIPLTDVSYQQLKDHAERFENYIVQLEGADGKLMIEGKRKTGFVGLIICLRNVFSIYDYHKHKGLEYLLTYKLLQDPIETFFSAIRSRGGFNNNPNAKQFETAYKKLLIRSEVSGSENGNCAIGDVQILHVSSINHKPLHEDPFLCNPDLLDDPIVKLDHDYVATWWGLSSYVDNVTQYIAGYVVFRLKKKIECNLCKEQLVAMSDDEVHTLIRIKNRGRLCFPSKDVINICQEVERVLRQTHVKKPRKEFLLLQVYALVCNCFNNADMDQHVSSQSQLDNHRAQLIKNIINLYLNIKLFHVARLASERDTNIRSKFHRLINFTNQ